MEVTNGEIRVRFLVAPDFLVLREEVKQTKSEYLKEEESRKAKPDCDLHCLSMPPVIC